MTSATDFAFATELFILVFGSFCWLFSSSRPQHNQATSTRSIRYFDLLDKNDEVSLVPPVSQHQSVPVLPDPWDSEEPISDIGVPVFCNSNDAPMPYQLCLPLPKKDVGFEVVLNLVQTELSLKNAQKILTVFAEQYQTAKPKSRTKKAELIEQIKAYLRDFNYKSVMQELVCDAIGGRLS